MPIDCMDESIGQTIMKATIQAEFRLFGRIRQKGGWFVAYCPPLNLTTQGKTLEEAQQNLIEASQLFITSCLERGTLDRALRELGFVPLKKTRALSPPPGTFQFPVPIPFGFEEPVECRA